MNSVDYIVGSDKVVDTPLSIFHDDVCNFITELSSGILSSYVVRAFPDLAALAFWGRKANLKNLKDEFGDISGRIGRGLCFHIAPSNIPINFAFSYLISLLAGNANVVRLPSVQYPQVDILCNIINNTLKSYPEIEKRTAFIRYDRSNEITGKFSKNADVRMIWGGDETILVIKSLPAPVHCIDIAFTDRYSIALIDGVAIENANDEQIQRLAENFYNDTYLMDQNACSSPQIIFWQNANNEQRDKFWNAIEYCAKRKYLLQDAAVVDKYTFLCEESISNENIKSIRYTGNLLYRAELKNLQPTIINHRGKCGFFYEYVLNDWRELFSVINRKFQTLTFFGIDPLYLRNEVVKANLKGIDRIVPIGKAMDIGTIWDGHDLIRELSRLIAL